MEDRPTGILGINRRRSCGPTHPSGAVVLRDRWILQTICQFQEVFLLLLPGLKARFDEFSDDPTGVVRVAWATALTLRATGAGRLTVWRIGLGVMGMPQNTPRCTTLHHHFGDRYTSLAKGTCPTVGSTANFAGLAASRTPCWEIVQR